MSRQLHGYIICFYILFSFINQSASYSQERGKIFSQYFSAKDYNAGEQNWDIAQDKNGILYVGNQEGLLQYDGTNWKKYELSNFTTVRSIEITDNGLILAGGINEFGYFSVNKYGKLGYTSLVGLIDSAYHEFGDVWNIEIVNDSWYFETDKYFFRIKNNVCKTWKNFGILFYLNFKFNNEMYLDVYGKGLYKITNDSLALVPQGDFFAQKKIHALLPYKNKMLIGTRSNGVYLFDPSGNNKTIPISEISPEAAELNKFLIKNEIYHSIAIDNNKYAIATVRAGTIVIDEKFNVIDVINKESTGISNAAFYIYYDYDGNLWLAEDNGIQKVELSSPFRYWDTDAGVLGSCLSFKEFDNTIYDGTGRGLFKLEKGNRNNRFGINKFISLLDVDDQVWSMSVLNPMSLNKFNKEKLDPKRAIGNYTINEKVLLAATNQKLYIINKKNQQKKIDYNDIYEIYPSISDSSCIYIGLRSGLARIRYQNGLWLNDGKLPNLFQQTRSIAEDSRGNIWFSSGFKGVYRIPVQVLNSVENRNFDQILKGMERFDTTSGLPMNEMIYIYKIKDKLKFYTQTGIYIFNESNKRFEKDKSVGSNYIDLSWSGEVYYDEFKKFWVNAVDRYKRDNKFYADTVAFKLLNKYNIVDAFRDNYNRIWFGTTEGVMCYHEKYIKNFYRKFPALLSKVFLGNDSVIFNGINYNENIVGTEKKYYINYSNQVDFKQSLSSKYNDISFTFTSISYESDYKVQYSCFLEGFDKEWSSWNTDVKRTYTNLPGGKFKFKVKAKNQYGIESSEASFSFEISSPWYLSWEAYIVYSFAILFLVILIVKIYTKKILSEKEKLEKIVQSRTQEILLQNEEILVQAEYLKEVNEEVKTKNEELEKRKNLLELSNATRNKFFRIIAHDLRNPISTFVNLTYFILDNYDLHETEKTRFFLKELNKLSQTTFNLLENLLDWSTNQMGEIRFDPKKINLSKLIIDNIELVNHRMGLKMISLSHSLPKILEVFADENMVHTIVRNLLSNAVKFTNEGGQIQISSSIANGFCEIKISDTGIGIKSQDIEKLFRIDKHFTNPGTQNEKGSGLGLILCKDFVEKNGGVLLVNSKEGEGSTFSFTLPIG